MKSIFDKTNLGKIKLDNRIFRSATWMAMSDNNGHLNEEIIKLYERLSKSEINAIITGITSIYPMDEKIYGMLSFDDDSYIEEHKKLTEIVHNNNSHIFMQIAIVEILTMYLDESMNFTKDEIKLIKQFFVDASIRAQKAGYDGVQLHAAHFFFLSKFISPLYNHRTDEYGGNNKKRSKILTEIIHEIKENTPDDFLVLIKINASDLIQGGLEIEDCTEICKILDKQGIDAIEVSANNTSRINIQVGVNEAYFLEYAKTIKNNVQCPVILVGGHRSIENMNKILNETNIEYLSLSRPLICEPDLIERWKNGNTKASRCISCNKCYNTQNHECIQNI